MNARLLIVDDEVALCEMLADSFRLSGYEVTTCFDGRSALRETTQKDFDLIITDINMPFMDGMEFIKTLRENQNSTPVIMLTARDSRPDINAGLRLGADDYVAKPFGLEELGLRVAAVLRRTMKQHQLSKLLECGPITLDEERHEVTLEGKPVDLSPTEFSLLRSLMLRPGRMVTKQTLLSQVWGISFVSDSNVVSTYISYLRKKLHTKNWQGIKTVRSLGFQINSGDD